MDTLMRYIYNLKPSENISKDKINLNKQQTIDNLVI